jgi:long-chain acyl-CoA synthetase
MVIDTLPKALVNMTLLQPERVAMRYKNLGLWQDVHWSEYLQKVKYVALGLHELGVRKNDHVAIIGENKPEWLYSAFGAMSAGATFVGVYTTNPVKECEYVVGHSESVVYLCEDEEQLDKALTFRNNTPALKKMIVWDTEGLRDFHDPMVMSLDELLALGEKIDREKPALFKELVAEGKG